MVEGRKGQTYSHDNRHGRWKSEMEKQIYKHFCCLSLLFDMIQLLVKLTNNTWMSLYQHKRKNQVWPRYWRGVTSLGQFTSKPHMALNQSRHVLGQITRAKGAVPGSLAPQLWMRPAITFLAHWLWYFPDSPEAAVKKNSTSACHFVRYFFLC